MKTRLILIISALLFMSSCSKNDGSQLIIGTWDWVKTSGGFSGITETPQSTGIQKILRVDQDKIYYYENGSLKRKSGYKVVKANSIYTSDIAELIKTEISSILQSFTVEDDTLILRDECYDCFEYVYIRVNR